MSETFVRNFSRWYDARWGERVNPAPVLAITVTTVARHCAGRPDSPYEALRMPRVAVSRGFVYLGPRYARWT